MIEPPREVGGGSHPPISSQPQFWYTHVNGRTHRRTASRTSSNSTAVCASACVHAAVGKARIEEDLQQNKNHIQNAMKRLRQYEHSHIGLPVRYTSEKARNTKSRGWNPLNI